DEDDENGELSKPAGPREDTDGGWREDEAADEADGPRERDDEMPVERIEREALVAARRIREMLESGAQVLERNRDAPPGLRSMRLDDIVILLRSAAGNAALLAAR